jgi:predicted nucleotidyltransferase
MLNKNILNGKNELANYVLNELNITEEILNIYPYGSRVYGTFDKDSDSDYIIVTKVVYLKVVDLNKMRYQIKIGLFKVYYILGVDSLMLSIGMIFQH